ncbi:hypothetical protein [Paraferrimonas sp. SM1919]|uniref:hypothetical protein n=1 Tax=Paraferrimonas sp. SM1919 TaxID=2662263 RepID=UPI0013D4CAA9|nr:hypothetical protein [Paraferrimonas sp. SM1919]
MTLTRLLLLAFLCPLTALSQGTSSISTAGQTVIKDKDYLGNPQHVENIYQPVTTALPFWRDEAIKRGYDLPLPFGGVISWMHMDQGLIVDNLKVDGAQLESVGLANASSVDNVISGRLDAWIFPFLNVYGVLGYTSGTMKAQVTIKDTMLDIDETIAFETDYDGITYGGGLTIAGGYKSFFAMIDSNATRSELNTGTNAIQTLTVTPRVGLLFDSTGYGTGTLWIGAMYINVDQTLTAALPANLGTLNADLSGKQAWNGLLGGSWELNKRYSFQAEVGGLGDRKQFMLSSMIRF